MIVTANIWFRTNWNDFKVSKVIPEMARHGLKDQGSLLAGEPLKAYVNNGRWIVSCECGGAEYAWEEEVFMCQSCWNARHGHKFRPAVFPSYRRQIEEVLELRLLPNRNWYESETVDDLKKENEAHKQELLGV